MYCAWVPLVEYAPTTEVFNDQFLITWNAAEANGSPVTGYKIFI